MQQKSKSQIAFELRKLNIAEIQALYTILIESKGDQETEDLALQLLELLEQKIKIEVPPLYGDPRVISIARSWNEPEFWMVLGDQTVWYVDPVHLGEDDPLLQKILINSLLGNYIIKDSNSEDQGPRVFESRRFPRGEFVGNMNVKKVSPDVIENKQIFSLEYGGFVE